LTFSRSENTSDATVRDLLKRGVNVAVVYWKHLPETDFGGFEVINGDENDLRFADPLGKVVGLKYKPSVADNPQDMKFICYRNLLFIYCCSVSRIIDTEVND
jgi:hypothetical protein